MQDIHPDNGDNTGKHNILILQTSPRHRNLIIINRYLLYLVMSLMIVVFLMGFLLWPTENPLNNLKPKHYPSAQANTTLSAEINTLKGQVVGLVSGSIESKLRILEESVRVGSMKNALGTIQDLKRDVRVLQSYSESSTQAPNQVVNEILLEEVSHLKHLIYLTLASGSLMFAAIAGIWIKKRYRLTFRKSAYLQRQK